jgi:hypothetical protein
MTPGGLPYQRRAAPRRLVAPPPSFISCCCCCCCWMLRIARLLLYFSSEDVDTGRGGDEGAVGEGGEAVVAHSGHTSRRRGSRTSGKRTEASCRLTSDSSVRIRDKLSAPSTLSCGCVAPCGDDVVGSGATSVWCVDSARHVNAALQLARRGLADTGAAGLRRRHPPHCCDAHRHSGMLNRMWVFLCPASGQCHFLTIKRI